MLNIPMCYFCDAFLIRLFILFSFVCYVFFTSIFDLITVLGFYSKLLGTRVVKYVPTVTKGTLKKRIIMRLFLFSL